jgi:hypothetical protein
VILVIDDEDKDESVELPPAALCPSKIDSKRLCLLVLPMS